ncbi:hypothetical protein DL93DRAFT_2092442 [Clavulina sp. PMI_390]|nr:hypothetical protein DL93DRAFT_2092442 [Clavulina sp. PMI_390]
MVALSSWSVQAHALSPQWLSLLPDVSIPSQRSNSLPLGAYSDSPVKSPASQSFSDADANIGYTSVGYIKCRVLDTRFVRESSVHTLGRSRDFRNPDSVGGKAFERVAATGPKRCKVKLELNSPRDDVVIVHCMRNSLVGISLNTVALYKVTFSDFRSVIASARSPHLNGFVKAASLDRRKNKRITTPEPSWGVGRSGRPPSGSWGLATGEQKA